MTCKARRLDARTQIRGQFQRAAQVVPLLAVCLVPVLGVVALALDGGMLLDDRRSAQAVADAAALAAAIDLYVHSPQNEGKDPSGTAYNSAINFAADNGYSTPTPTVNIPPKSGRATGLDGYAEVIITYNQNRAFSAIWGSGTIPVSARAVARGTSVPYTNAGVIVLNPTAQKALNVTGPGNLTVKSGPIIVNSNFSSNPGAAAITGSGNVTAPEVDITASGSFAYTNSSSGHYIIPASDNGGLPRTGRAATPDPLANLAEPDPSALTVRGPGTLSHYSSYNINSTITLQPGRYPGGIKISGGNVTLAANDDGTPGIYYMDKGGFSVSNGTVTGSNIMIFNNPDPGSGEKVTMTGGDFTLSAPTSGTYQGMMIFQARGAGSVPVAITGPGTSQMLGTVYAKSANVTVTGAGGATIASQVIGDTVTLTGQGDFNIDFAGTPAPGQRSITMTE